jgi:hypothetical protein
MSDTPRVRDCSHEKDTASLAQGTPRICIPIDPDTDRRILGDATAFRQYVDPRITLHPEVFPPRSRKGMGFMTSCRRPRSCPTFAYAASS